MVSMKTKEIIEKWPFGVSNTETFSKTDENGNSKKFDWIILDKSEGLIKVSRLGSILYNHIIEVDEESNTSIKTPFTLQQTYRITSNDYTDTVFLERIYTVFDELCEGEHLEEQFAEGALINNRALLREAAKRIFEKLYLEIIDGFVYICSPVDIGDSELKSKYNGGLVDTVVYTLKNVERGAFALREVLGIEKEYW